MRPDELVSSFSRRLLVCLAAPGARILPAVPSSKDCPVARRQYDVRGYKKRSGVLAPEVFDELLSRGLIETSADVGWKISGAGKSWLRRALSSEDAFRAQHTEIELRIVENDSERSRVRVNVAESPLAWLRRRKDNAGRPFLSDEQFNAGERLRADYERGNLMPSISQNWSPIIAGSVQRGGGNRERTELLDETIAARERVRRALLAVGDEFADILVDVCCYLRGIEDLERKKSWPRRSGKVILRLGLTSLARHYGFLMRNETHIGCLRHWGDTDFRPRIGD